MKKMKRLAAMLLALVMVLGMSMTVFAEVNETKLNGATPSSIDKVNITIGGLKEGDGEDVKFASVKLYQIATADYSPTTDQAGFIGTYTWATGISETDIDAIIKMAKGETSDEDQEDLINRISQGIQRTPATVNAEEITAGKVDSNGTSNTEVGAGVYIAVITGSGKYIYNPLLLTATYNEDGNLEGGIIATAEALYGANGTAKRSEQDVDKKINVEVSSVVVEDEDIANIDGNKPQGQQTASLGSVIAYEVKPTIPTYPANAINKTFYITDRMDEGLTFDFSSLEIKLKGVEGSLKATDGEFKIGETVIARAATVTEDVKTGFNLAFEYDNLKAIVAGENGRMVKGDVVVSYKARVNEKAIVGKEGNINKATLIFTRNPNVGKTWNDPNDEPGPDKDNAEGLDQKEKEEIVYTYQIAFLKKGEGENDEKGLANAIFGIYSTKEDESGNKVIDKLVDTVITNSAGYAVSTQVSKGWYIVKEIQAPTGYSLNTSEYLVEATWTKANKTVIRTETKREYTSDPDESLNKMPVGWILGGKFYSGKKPSEDATVAYIKSETKTETTVTTIEKSENTVGAGTAYVGEIENTKMSSLPSTGGIGTTIFTIGGCLIMIIAAGLFFASRRKSSK